jgi:hypothetical protein
MKSFCLPRELLLVSILRNEWVEFPHVELVDEVLAARKKYEYTRLRPLIETSTGRGCGCFEEH